jgi:hypothetical protein
MQFSRDEQFYQGRISTLCQILFLRSQFAGFAVVRRRLVKPLLQAPTPAPDGKEVKKVVETPKPPEPRFKLDGWIEGGITGNPDSPIDNHNFGHLFTDRANEPLLNQVSVVGERALDRKTSLRRYPRITSR